MVRLIKIIIIIILLYYIYIHARVYHISGYLRRKITFCKNVIFVIIWVSRGGVLGQNLGVSGVPRSGGLGVGGGGLVSGGLGVWTSPGEFSENVLFFEKIFVC